MSRIESAAATRRGLLDEAAALLDVGGPDAVTLRDVAARAGVSRGAPYRHFDDKECLLTAVAAEGWKRLGDHMRELRTDSDRVPADTLHAALSGIITFSRQQPYLYQLMFSTPTGDQTAVVRAAQFVCDEFAAIVGSVVGARHSQRCAAILLTGAHGAAGLGSSGLLSTDRWNTTSEELLEALVEMVVHANHED